MSSAIRAIRVGAYSVGIVASVLVLINATRASKLEERWLQNTLSYPHYLLICGALTLGTFPFLFLVGYLRKSSIFATILTEMCWFTILGILWAIGGVLTQKELSSNQHFDCTMLGGMTEEQEFEQNFINLRSMCVWYANFRSSGFVAGGLFLVYSISLFVVGMAAVAKGNSIWLSAATAPGFYASQPTPTVISTQRPEKESTRPSHSGTQSV